MLQSFRILLQLLLIVSLWLIFRLWIENQTRVSDHEAIHGTKNHPVWANQLRHARREGETKRENLHSFQSDKKLLIANQAIPVHVSGMQLRKTIRATDERKQNCQRHEAKEELQAGGLTGLAGGRVAATVQTEVADHVVGEESTEEENGEDLETHPGKREIDANLTCA